MVSTGGERETSALHGPMTKYHSGKGVMLPHDRYFKVALSRVSWSCEACSLTVEEVRKVQ